MTPDGRGRRSTIAAGLLTRSAPSDPITTTAHLCTASHFQAGTPWESSFSIGAPKHFSLNEALTL